MPRAPESAPATAAQPPEVLAADPALEPSRSDETDEITGNPDRMTSLACGPAEQGARLARTPPLQRRWKTRLAPETGLPTLQKVREHRDAIVDPELETGLRAIAVPLHDAGCRAVAAISIGMPSARVPVSEPKPRYLSEPPRISRELSLQVA